MSAALPPLAGLIGLLLFRFLLMPRYFGVPAEHEDMKTFAMALLAFGSFIVPFTIFDYFL